MLEVRPRAGGRRGAAALLGPEPCRQTRCPGLRFLWKSPGRNLPTLSGRIPVPRCDPHVRTAADDPAGRRLPRAAVRRVVFHVIAPPGCILAATRPSPGNDFMLASFFALALASAAAAPAPADFERMAQANLPEYLELVAIPNVASEPADIRRNADFLEAALERRGFAVQQ